MSRLYHVPASNTAVGMISVATTDDELAGLCDRLRPLVEVGRRTLGEWSTVVLATS